ncbi:MAG: chromosome segregation protein [Devosia sp.]|nr:chromosome segregation protein [Devosia sp.]
MKFSQLRLHGFKSFAEETLLQMEPGLTGIVGPNGCGKSNLVEAMRWAMGESSYRAMRASGMDDVIFGGSGNRPARNSAEVTLVLDNTDRTAPAALNIADTLEVTRRIEREAGSVYRVNGREVRARDVQLLFADASTGAHSPAMVRQGQIGELISAKPTARRALLEEAAGISGLHTRRHEAELRLRAAEQNLERVDDITAQVETQLDALKRQARLAIRYRGLSGEIRSTEATLFHLHWVAAVFAEKETEANQAVLIRAQADATGKELAAQRALDAAQAELQPLRERETVAAAVLQRYEILLEQLAEEERRGQQRQAELELRLQQLAADRAREEQLVREGEAALAAGAAEIAQLQDEADSAAEALASARSAADAARAEIVAAEAEAREAEQALAEERARRTQAERYLAELDQRLHRLRTQSSELERDAAALEARGDADDELAQQRATLQAAQRALGEAEKLTLGAEQATLAAQARLDVARPRLQATEAGVIALEAEAATLIRMLDLSDRLWRAVVDDLAVAPGYETALGAALGDDLEASTDPDSPLHWAPAPDGSDDPPLPQGAEPLSRHVHGEDGRLKRRLDQIGVIDAADGPALQLALRPGQRLVTLAGALWRWDGFIAAADAPGPAAQRLAQRNRLHELDAETSRAKGERNSWKREVETLTAALDLARTNERNGREGWRRAQHALTAAQNGVNAAQRALADLAARRAALEAARAQLTASIGDTEQARNAAAQAVAELGDYAEAAAEASRQQQRLTQMRAHADQTRTALLSLEAGGRLRQARVAQLHSEAAQWQRRRDTALDQQQTLGQRSAAIEQELGGQAATPEGLEQRRATLENQIAQARLEHDAARAQFDAAQSRVGDAEKALKAAGDAANAVRLELTRIEERLKGHLAQRQAVERQVQETLGIPASRTLEVSGIRPQQALPAEGAVESRLERLRAERDRLGGVNLSAEAEAGETQAKLDAMVKDRNDLIEAIAKLRTGIGLLNREGRARLTEAFDRVNGYFGELFTTLFGGGTAELQLVESDDPLQAGLEILAHPPGKKPQTMTLLSGGEQALTALSLIFAVFLTNPAPICVLDEVDAPLDDANVERFCNLLDNMRERTQTRFLCITHNPITMSRMDRLFGVTMAERGVSQLVSVDLRTAESFLEAV